MIEQVLTGFQAMSAWEYVAVLLGLSYVILVMKESLWCWPAAFVSTLIYTILFWQGALLMESFLSFYYLLMAIYGWWQWNKLDKISNAKLEKSIVSWSTSKHTKWIGAATVTFLILGYVMDEYTHAKIPYLDAFTTVFAIMTTYMVTQKVLENWLYWIVIDIASIFLYLEMGYYPTAVLSVLYTILAWQGFQVWRKQLPNKQFQPN
ncbi:nicotinamide mononucleotide transporter [Psychrosphaera saromensis]|uniref:Nicotinamide riboside transporter PnuC n=1 Tax=Psychrosphaera saromensis TaxID=716813 RepID=A0A2S7UUE8_9GAMM|nr:nicotinamide riboside transporter PnuC [Psychrosphaera saromensis]PQJ52900.1 nicotinamide mononucleotide transporter [Psychrosphaera saromensis]GHB78943.1 nicotinamide mononucleotide transporter [Psychrosphaera saromensis]GLQ14643.1 nicotinamide mononucleotide transporter [Psychrosphaera saromensis]